MNVILISLVVCLVGYEMKKIEKRNLVSRFTSNPFFLRHFAAYPTYETLRPAEDFFTGSDGKHSKITNFKGEKPLLISILRPEENEDHFDHNHKVQEETDKLMKNNEETLLTKELFLHKVPLFEKSEVFKNEDQERHSVKKLLEINGKIFRSLPHFEKTQAFGKVAEKTTNSSQGKNFGKTPSEVKIEENFGNDSNGIFYIFGSLPHFERLVPFQNHITATESPFGEVEQTNGPVPISGNQMGKSTAPVFGKLNINNIAQIDPEVQIEENREDNFGKSPKETFYVFGSLPHFERLVSFQNSIKVTEKPFRVIEGTKGSFSISGNFQNFNREISNQLGKTTASVFGKLNFNNEAPFVPEVKIEENREDNSGNSPHGSFFVFGSLPHFERLIPFQSEIKSVGQTNGFVSIPKKSQNFNQKLFPENFGNHPGKTSTIVKNVPNFGKLHLNKVFEEKSEEIKSENFRNLPYFERLIPFGKQWPTNQTHGFKTLPDFENQQNAHQTEEPTALTSKNLGTKRPKKIKKIIRKLGPREPEFGERLRPIVRVKNVADFPLEDSVDSPKLLVNSYGNLL